VDVYLEEANGGYCVYFMKGNTKTYLDIVARANDATKTDVVFQTSGTHSIYKLNTEFKYLYTTVNGTDWYLGTYGTFNTVSASKTSYISDTSKIGVSQFCAWFYQAGTTPEPETPAGPTAVETPVVGTAYKFGLQQNGLEGKPTLLITGEKDGYYYGTTQDVAAAVDVYLEEANGGYCVYFMKGNTKTYLDIVARANDASKTDVVFQTSGTHSIYKLNTEFKYLYTTVNGTDWYLGTYGTFNTISASKTSYISDTSKIGVSQFCAWFYQAGTGSTTPDAPAANEAILMNDKPIAGDIVIIYNSGYAMTGTNNEGKMVGLEAAVDGDKLPIKADMLKLTVAVDGDKYVFVADGKYLTSGASGDSMSLESTLTDCGKWTFEVADAGSWYLKNVGANYNGNYNQAMEYYKGFTTYGIKQNAAYKMQLFKAGTGAAPVLPAPETPAPEVPTGETYVKIDKVADLTAGTYKMAAYLLQDSNSNDLSATPYHIWTGATATSSGKTDLVTTSYGFADSKLTVKSGGTDNAAEIELIAVAGKANTYYIKYDGKYLYAKSANNRQLGMDTTPAEWVATDYAQGGIMLTNGPLSIGTASAASKFIRGYIESSLNSLKYGLVFFAAQ